MKDFRNMSVQQSENILNKINDGVEAVCIFYGLERYLKKYNIEIVRRDAGEYEYLYTITPPLKYIDIKGVKGNIRLGDEYYIEQTYPLYHTLHKVIVNIMNSECEGITENDFRDINRAVKYINSFKLIPKINMFDVELEKAKELKKLAQKQQYLPIWVATQL